MWKKVLASCLLAIAFTTPVMASDEPLTLDWIDLVPEAERKLFDSVGMPASDHSGGAAQQSKIGNVRPELNGSQVKIPGFVIPLEGDANTVTEFFVGAVFWGVYPRTTTTTKPNHLREISERRTSTGTLGCHLRGGNVKNRNH